MSTQDFLNEGAGGGIVPPPGDGVRELARRRLARLAQMGQGGTNPIKFSNAGTWTGTWKGATMAGLAAFAAPLGTLLGGSESGVPEWERGERFDPAPGAPAWESGSEALGAEDEAARVAEQQDYRRRALGILSGRAPTPDHGIAGPSAVPDAAGPGVVAPATADSARAGSEQPPFLDPSYAHFQRGALPDLPQDEPERDGPWKRFKRGARGFFADQGGGDPRLGVRNAAMGMLTAMDVGARLGTGTMSNQAWSNRNNLNQEDMTRRGEELVPYEDPWTGSEVQLPRRVWEQVMQRRLSGGGPGSGGSESGEFDPDAYRRYIEAGGSHEDALRAGMNMPPSSPLEIPKKPTGNEPLSEALGGDPAAVAFAEDAYKRYLGEKSWTGQSTYSPREALEKAIEDSMRRYFPREYIEAKNRKRVMDYVTREGAPIR